MRSLRIRITSRLNAFRIYFNVTLKISDNKSHTFISTIGPCGAMVARLTPDQRLRVRITSRSNTFRLYFIVTLKISDNKSHTFICTIGPCGEMVARLTPDQKVTCSNRVEVKSLS